MTHMVFSRKRKIFGEDTKMQKYFNEIADNRHQSYVKHRLQDILVMIMCAVLDITL